MSKHTDGWNLYRRAERSNNVLFSHLEHVLLYLGEVMFMRSLNLKISKAHLKHLVFSTISSCDKSTFYSSYTKQYPSIPIL